MKNEMPKYLLTSDEAKTTEERGKSYKTFDEKLEDIRELINSALYLIDQIGIPVEDKSPRQRERMAIVFLALCDVKDNAEWPFAKSLDDGYSLTTREIITYLNNHFGEKISSGSYDDIRRKDLLHLCLGEVVISDSPTVAKNAPNRAWALNPVYGEIIKSFGQENWEKKLEAFMSGRETLQNKLASHRPTEKIPVYLPSGQELEFGPGEHNQLQKAIIEEFLTRYGYGAEIIYVGDASNRFLHYDREKANILGISELSHDELPDIIAYSKKRNWLYFIEAVHSSGPISSERKIALTRFVASCTAPVVYVTAFLDRETFRKFVSDIAWETVVWIAEDPDHLIHFDGDRFFGPYPAINY